MPPRILAKKFIVGISVLLALGATCAFFVYGLLPASADASAAPVIFTVTPGEGFRAVVSGLADAHLIRSPLATETYAVMTGGAFSLKPGAYLLSPARSAPAIIGELANAEDRSVSVTIPPDASLYQVDAILADALVLPRDALVNFHNDGSLEGKLFPDTYRFFTASDPEEVVQKMLDNFNAKAGPVLAADPSNATSDLIMASMIEKEVPAAADQSVVAGILAKRERAGMPLQVDATICYAMQAAEPTGIPDCGALDLKIDSPYNTYLYKGFPPTPIGSPDLKAIEAATRPQHSPYWYYLSDPRTGKTIFATTLDEQHQNTVKYLDSN